MFFSSIKEINRLISKWISNTYLRVSIEKNWRSENFDFKRLKNLCLGQFLEFFFLQLKQIPLNFNRCLRENCV